MSTPHGGGSRYGVLALAGLLAAGLVWNAGSGHASHASSGATASPPTTDRDGDAMTMKKLTPVLYVEEIEPCLPFWTERLGFEVTGTVPEGDRLGFAMLQKDGVEIMYQTRASMENDVRRLADRPTGSAFLFIEVEDLGAVESALSDVEKVVPRRTTPYGATEVGVLEPGGNAVVFAEFGGGG